MPQTLRQTQPQQQQQTKPVLQPFDTSFEHISEVLAALGTNCFIPNLPKPTPALIRELTR